VGSSEGLVFCRWGEVEGCVVDGMADMRARGKRGKGCDSRRRRLFAFYSARFSAGGILNELF
jgi:hypothetical protein